MDATGSARRSWMQAKRFEFMEWKLFWEGQLNRSDLENAFEISTPQASIDLRNYRDRAGGNLMYDATAKRFAPSAGMKPLYLEPSADRLLLQLRAWLTRALPRRDIWFRNMPPIDMVPDVARHVDPDCLRLIMQAMRTGSAIDVEYQSLTNARWRRIAPHALAFDGFRWHVRAYATDRNDFRDFVLSRISALGAHSEVTYDPADDLEWYTDAVLRLKPHPGLTDEQSWAVQRDFSMADGVRELPLRLSMAYYFIKRMNLDLVDLPAARVQVTLENLAEIDASIRSARLESRRRLAEKGPCTVN